MANDPEEGKIKLTELEKCASKIRLQNMKNTTDFNTQRPNKIIQLSLISHRSNPPDFFEIESTKARRQQMEESYHATVQIYNKKIIFDKCKIHYKRVILPRGLQYTKV